MAESQAIKVWLIHPETHLGGITCPFCLDPFEVGQAVIVCPGCQTIHHVVCWEENVDRCCNANGCEGTGKADWIVPLGVARRETVQESKVDQFSVWAFQTVGGSAQVFQDVDWWPVFLAHLVPTYVLALHYYLALRLLDYFSNGGIRQNPWIGWQSWLATNIWRWLLMWAALLIVFTLIDTLRTRTKHLSWQIAALTLRVVAFLVLAGSAIPVVVEVLFSPGYVWPAGFGVLFLDLAWIKWLLIIFAIPFLVFFTLPLIGGLAPVPHIVNTYLGLTLIFVFVMLSIETLGASLMISGGTALAQAILRLFGIESSMLKGFLYIGLFIGTGMTFTAALARRLFTEARQIWEQAKSASKERKTLQNA